MRRLLPAVLCAALALGLPAGARAGSLTVKPVPETPVQVAISSIPKPGRNLSAQRALAIASALAKVREARHGHKGSYGAVYTKGPFRWQVSFFSRAGGKVGGKELAQVLIADRTGRVLEAWSGFQVAWTMARGYKGAFGEHAGALYIWLPLCLLFMLPFVNFRRPLSLLHLDLLVLLSLSVSLAFFNHANIWASVPAAYPPLLYLLGRMLWMLRRRAAGTSAPGPLRLLIPAPWLAVAVVFLVGFRVGLNVTDSNVIDVGYAGVIGAQRITHDRPLYGGFPADNEHGDTYGPFNYEAYVPFERAFGWGGRWDDLPAAHAAAIFFDLLTVGLLFLLGRRMRGPTLGIALAYAWVSYPFTLFALESNANDTLVAAAILAALLAAGYGSGLARFARGGFAALAALTKLAPLALAPILATHGLREQSMRRRLASLALFAAGFLAVGALAMVPALAHDSLHTVYERTLVYQGNRDSPFSVWGLYGWRGAELAAEVFAAGLALVLAVIPRRSDMVGLAAGCAAIMIAVQLAMEHWFYLYIPWFFALAIVALLGRFSPVPAPAGDGASEPARSTPRAAALST